MSKPSDYERWCGLIMGKHGRTHNICATCNTNLDGKPKQQIGSKFYCSQPCLPKTISVFVKCLVTNSEGDPVNKDGELLTGRQKPWYSWEKRRKSVKWLIDPKNKELWQEVGDE